MPLRHIAQELEETARQSDSMADAIVTALKALQAAGSHGAAEQAMHDIVVALQAQDRVAQRCRGLACALTRIAEVSSTRARDSTEIWDGVTPGELWPAGMTARPPEPAEIELF